MKIELEYKNDNPEMEHKFENFSIEEIKEDQEKKLVKVKGIANKVGILDRGRDFTREGAFTETVKENPLVPALAFHDMNKPVGLNKLSVAKDGSLLTEMELNLDVQEAKELYSLIKQYQDKKRPMELSIGYKAEEFSFGEIDNRYVRYLDKVKVYEVSIVPYGMNQGSQITAVKKFEIEKIKEKTNGLINENQKLKNENELLKLKVKTLNILGGNHG